MPLTILRGFLLALCILLISGCSDREELRVERVLDTDWSTLLCDTLQLEYADFKSLYSDPGKWVRVDLPHNWDDYGGYRRLVHGNLHGYAWYYREISAEGMEEGKRLFLLFEGVSSYAKVWINGQEAGEHAGGRTSFTIDITEFLEPDGENLLVVRADHPSEIRDLPWVCGGCSSEWGFSEGSQPLGIYRPVRLIITNDVRIEPFGVQIWNDANISAEKAGIHIRTEVKNYGGSKAGYTLVSRMKDRQGEEIRKSLTDFMLDPGQTRIIEQQIQDIRDPELWSPNHPYLYSMESEILRDGKRLDFQSTSFGIRWIHWDIGGEEASGRFFINGEPQFINGIGEYEHLMGQSHAFSDKQVRARIEQIRAAGFNAFRDGHQPHNLAYNPNWDSLGVIWWTQLSAHIWFDNPEFRKNFKKLLAEWVKERRNSPSVVLWGLQNESTLPEDFARECTELIRELDPTTSSQRLVTTCNGGTGTDWNVIQNWSGTYGGNPRAYDRDLARQKLNGEYGAWRSLDMHTEGPFEQSGPLSEDRMWLLMESKIRLAESVRDSCSGQFLWIFNSHDNPGRRQSGEGLRELDRIGPVNYKGLLTNWGEPVDAFYMYRANYVSPGTQPMVYIVSHTWPDRWTEPGIRDGIRVFSNCDSVELFNDVRSSSLGVRTRKGIGTHFRWDRANIRYNVLYAVAYLDGKEAANDCILLHHLPPAPSLDQLAGNLPGTPQRERNYIYRVNCGGPEYKDRSGFTWSADVPKSSGNTWGSLSWTDDYPELPHFFGSQRQTHDPIQGSLDWPLLQNFRYGRHKLAWEFPLPDGDYQLELYFIEPWYGTGGGLDCKGWRVFDVAVNGETVLEDLDIWAEAGHDKLLKKTIPVRSEGGKIRISFPEVSSGQAIISAIAISSMDMEPEPSPPGMGLISSLVPTDEKTSGQWSARTWLDTGRKPYSDDDAAFSVLTPEHYGAEWIQTPSLNASSAELARFTLTRDAMVYIGMDSRLKSLPAWLSDYELTGREIRSTYGNGCSMKVYRKFYPGGTEIVLGENAGSEDIILPMYSVAVAEFSGLEAAIDLRPVQTYQAEEGRLLGSAFRGRFMERQGVKLSGGGDGLEWEFGVGLASMYGLEFRFLNRSGKDIPVNMKLVGVNGIEYLSEELIFSGERPRWQSVRTDTRSMINAGKYRIILSLEEDEEICFNWLRVQ